MPFRLSGKVERRMDVITLASQKGGAGKTTLSGHLAIAAEQRGVGSVVLIDTDPQGSLTSWWNRRAAETPMLSPLTHPRDLPGHLAELRRAGHALVIIDTPPAISSTIREVMRVCDLVVMPVRPSPHDLVAIGATIELAHAASARFIFALTQAKLNARVTPQAVALLSAHGVVASSIIRDRVLYATAMTDGRTVGDVEPKGAAAAEILALWDFIHESLIGGKEGRTKVA
jgi:chromosome partitioning protein